MNPDRKKLMQILKNLERDYEAGLISEEKYRFLYDQYMHKINTIEVSDRIRAMQGKEETPSSFNSRYDVSDKYREEKEQLVRKYVHNPETYSVSKKPESSSTNPWYVAFAVIFLLLAFGAGITFGMTNINLDGDVTHMLSGSGATINDTAFPEVKINKTLTHNYTKSYSNVSYGSYDDSSSSSSSSYSNGGSSYSGGGSSSDGSSSGDYSGGGSSSGGGSGDGGSSGGGSDE